MMLAKKIGKLPEHKNEKTLWTDFSLKRIGAKRTLFIPTNYEKTNPIFHSSVFPFVCMEPKTAT